MEILRYKEELNFTMVGHMRKMLHTLDKRNFVLAFSLIVVMLFAFPAWSEPSGHDGRKGLHRGHGYGDHKVQQRWVAQNDQGKKRKSHQSLSPEEKSRLNGKIKKWKSLPPEEQNELRHKMEKYKKLPSQDRKLYEKRFHQMQELPPSERRKVKDKLKKLDSLSPKEKEELRRKFKNQ
jgi:hypothetical protein